MAEQLQVKMENPDSSGNEDPLVFPEYQDVPDNIKTEGQEAGSEDTTGERVQSPVSVSEWQYPKIGEFKKWKFSCFPLKITACRVLAKKFIRWPQKYQNLYVFEGKNWISFFFHFPIFGCRSPPQRRQKRGQSSRRRTLRTAEQRHAGPWGSMPRGWHVVTQKLLQKPWTRTCWSWTPTRCLRPSPSSSRKPGAVFRQSATPYGVKYASSW